MNTMKGLISCLIGLATIVVLSASAAPQLPGRHGQGYYGEYSFSTVPGISNTIPANANYTFGTILDLRQTGDVDLYATFTGADSGTSNLVYTFAFSADGTNVATTPRITWTIPQNSSNAVIARTNISMAASGYLVFVGATSTALTNLATNKLEICIKPNRYGFH